MKKLLGLVLSGMLMISMVGCTDSVEEQVEEQQTPPVQEEPKDEYVEPEEVIEEPEMSKEEVAYLIKMAIQETIPTSRYEIEVVINENGNCVIGIADTQVYYSTYTKDEMKSMCEQAGLDSAAKDVVDYAIDLFYEYGYEDIMVTLVLTGNDYVPFMIMDNTGKPVYS